MLEIEFCHHVVCTFRLIDPVCQMVLVNVEDEKNMTISSHYSASFANISC